MCQTIDLKKSLRPQRLMIAPSNLWFQQMSHRRRRKPIVGRSNRRSPASARKNDHH